MLRKHPLNLPQEYAMDIYPKVRLEAGALHLAKYLIHSRGLFLAAKVILFLETTNVFDNCCRTSAEVTTNPLRAINSASRFQRQVGNRLIHIDSSVIISYICSKRMVVESAGNETRSKVSPPFWRRLPSNSYCL